MGIDWNADKKMIFFLFPFAISKTILIFAVRIVFKAGNTAPLHLMQVVFLL